MTSKVQLVFRGEVLTGFQVESVQLELGRLVRANEAQLRALFSGRSVVLKRGLASDEGARYARRLAAIGAQVHLEPETPTATPAPAGTARDLALVPAVPPAADEAEVACPKCGERQTMRLLCNGCATNLEMAFALLEEEKEQRRAERQAALDARLGRRSRADPVVDEGERSAWPLGFGFSGRVGRLAGATANLWLIGAMLLLTAGFLGRPSLPRALLLGLGALAMFFFSMRLTVLRCHDCGRHGWWALFVLVPYAGSVASLLFSLLPGDRGDNEYGPPPPRARWVWFFVALGVLVLSGALAMRAGLLFLERQAAAQPPTPRSRSTWATAKLAGAAALQTRRKRGATTRTHRSTRPLPRLRRATSPGRATPRRPTRRRSARSRSAKPAGRPTRQPAGWST